MKRAQESVAALRPGPEIPQTPTQTYVRKEDSDASFYPPTPPAADRPGLSFRPAPSPGPACVVCTHHTCRVRRAEHLPRLGGHRAEFATEHSQAAQVQAQHRNYVIWFGESTQSFWVASSTEMVEAKTLDGLLAYLWARSQRRFPQAWR